MKKLVLGAVAVCGLAAAGWYVFGPGSDMSGTYIGEDPHAAILVQIIQGSGGQLSGFFEEADLTADGQVKQDSVQLSGLRDGRTFTIMLLPSGLAKLFVQPFGLSGTYTGTSLSLVGQTAGSNFSLNLLKGDAQTYQAYVNTLNGKAQAIQAQKAAALAQQQEIEAQQAAAQQAAAAAQDLEGRIETDLQLSAAVPATVAQRVTQLGNLSEKLRSETAKMQASLAREQALGGYQSGTGSQISEDIESANGDEADRVSGEQDRLSNIEQNGIPALLQKFEEHDAQCQRIGATEAGQASFTGPDELLRDCLAMEASTPGLQSQVETLLGAYQGLFDTWRVENAKQQEIIQESEH